MLAIVCTASSTDARWLPRKSARGGVNERWIDKKTRVGEGLKSLPHTGIFTGHRPEIYRISYFHTSHLTGHSYDLEH